MDVVILQNNVDIIDSQTCYKNFKNIVNLKDPATQALTEDYITL